MSLDLKKKKISVAGQGWRTPPPPPRFVYAKNANFLYFYRSAGNNFIENMAKMFTIQ